MFMILRSFADWMTAPRMALNVTDFVISLLFKIRRVRRSPWNFRFLSLQRQARMRSFLELLCCDLSDFVRVKLISIRSQWHTVRAQETPDQISEA